MFSNLMGDVSKEQYKKLLMSVQELAIENQELKIRNQELSLELQKANQLLLERDTNFRHYLMKIDTKLEAQNVIIEELKLAIKERNSRILELERQVNMNSKNSSMPPSSDKKFDKNTKKETEEDDDSDGESNSGTPQKKINLLEKLQEFAKNNNKPMKFTIRDITVLETILLTREFAYDGIFGSKRSTIKKLIIGDFASCYVEEIESLLKIKEFVLVADYKRRGGQIGHKGYNLKQIENPDKIKWIEPKICKCGCTNFIIDRDSYEARQEIDVLIKRIVTEYRLAYGDCTNCGNLVKATSNHPNNVFYHNNIRCYAVYMLDAQFMTYERLGGFFRDILDVQLSEGSINNWRREFAQSVGKDYLPALKKILLDANYLNADETTINVVGDKIWCHTVCNESGTLLSASISRGVDGITASGVLDKYDGNLIVDGWSSYKSLPLIKGIQSCFAHLFRYFKDINENYKQEWSLAMLVFLSQFIEMTKELHKSGIAKYSKKQRATFYKEYEQILKSGRKELLRFDFKDDHKAWRLLRRLEKDKTSVLLFLNDTSLPLTNNMAERSLRPLKVQQKISGTMLSIQNATENLDIRSFIATTKKQGQNVLKAMLKIFKNHSDFEIKAMV